MTDRLPVDGAAIAELLSAAAKLTSAVRSFRQLTNERLQLGQFFVGQHFREQVFPAHAHLPRSRLQVLIRSLARKIHRFLSADTRVMTWFILADA